MSTQDWTRTVFRLRNLPNRISNSSEAGKLLSDALGLPIDHVTIYSLAKTTDVWEVPPSRVATLQLKSVPSCIEQSPKDEVWHLPVPHGTHRDVLLLDSHFRGMTALNDVDPAIHRADCIAISGLASHPFGSWQPHGRDKTFMWIRDAIPSSIPGIRAVIYGYDSKLVGSNSFQSISDMGQGLILQLKVGGWNSPSSKPVVFLAHSLGGLVLKEAIVQMADREKTVAAILDNVLGAIMFGVPSLGMEQSHLMAMVEGQPNESLVQDLSRGGGGNYVRQLNTRFEGLSFLRTARILWAYETEESRTVKQRPDGTWSRDGPYAVLVNPESATCHNCHKNMSLTIPINKDHSNMVKFPRGDANLSVVIQSIEEFCSPQKLARRETNHSVDIPLGYQKPFRKRDTAVDTDDEISSLATADEAALQELGQLLSALDNLHSSLYSIELDFRMSQIDDPFRDTFKWVFDLPKFTYWLQKGPDLFWIHGKPGSGKSTLMKFIFRSKETWELLHDWKTGSLELTAGFFFHYRGTALQKSFEGVLKSLITQILTPHRVMYQKQYQPTWEKFRSLKDEQLKHDRRRRDFKRNIQILEREIEEIRLGSRVGGLAGLEKQVAELRSELPQLDTLLAATQTSIASLASEFKPHSHSSMTKFLAKVVADFGDESDGQIPRLERVLRRLLDQEVIKTDLVLFFDALDEFDGHLDLISRFLKDLAKLPTKSLTRVKVCFSSRPWEPLKTQFLSYPNFALQDYTKHDIEAYVTGIVARSAVANKASFVRLLPYVIAKADGVFLWVRLALNVLIEKAALDPENSSTDKLKENLRELPADLFKFYELIIERISNRNRRRTFALLELLIRHNGPPVTARDIRDATLTSECTNLQEASSVIMEAHKLDEAGMPALPRERINNDIYTWGGGLVEIKIGDDKVERPQLMHQTVLEFTMGLAFKRIVVGDLASIVNENGHSFHLKYWTTRTTWVKYNRAAAISMLKSWHTDRTEVPRARHLHANLVNSDKEALQHLLYHAEQSEITTGRSHFEFLYHLNLFGPFYSHLGGLDPQSWGRGFDSDFVFLIASCGLGLCLRDWIASKPTGELERLPIPPNQAQGIADSFDYPLLSCIVFAPPFAVFYGRYLTTIRLLLENGYTPRKEPGFFHRLMMESWRANADAPNSERVPVQILHKLLDWALEYGADPETEIDLYSDQKTLPSKVKPLHIAAPSVAVDLIRHGANPNARDSCGRTPLDWAIELQVPIQTQPRMPGDASINRVRQKYDICDILLKARGVLSEQTPQMAWKSTLEQFQTLGHDLSFMRECFQAQSLDRPMSLEPASPKEGQVADESSKGEKWRKGKSHLKKIFRLGKGR